MEVIVAVGTCLVLWFGARMVLSGALSAGSLVVFILYLGKMYKPMQELSKMTDAYSKAAVGYERIREVLETDNEIKDLPGARRAPQFKGGIEFENVSFGYEPAHASSQGCQLPDRAGTGGRAGGSHRRRQDHHHQPDPALLRSHFRRGEDRRPGRSAVPAEVAAPADQLRTAGDAAVPRPIWNNIAYGKPEATRAEILRAAELANAHEFIEKMPEGYNTMVGERGVTLSGGQRQRIAIARAIIRNTPILILDEPSSGLDAASEKLVFEALDRLMEGKTSIVIAHRLSTIRRANCIFVVNDGTIVERGTHEELMRSGGLYSQLHDIQFAPEESQLTEPRT